MPTDTYTITFPMVMGILLSVIGSVAWFLIQRQMKKSDDDSTKATTAIEARFRDHEVRMNQHGDRLRETEILMERKVSRDEMDRATEKVFSAVEGLRSEIKTEIQALQSAILSAVAERRGGQ